MFDERTPYLDLRLPNLTNPLKVDVDRLRETITLIDQYLHAVNTARGVALGDATLDVTGKVPASQLPEMLAVGVIMDYALSTLPSAGWRFCNGDVLVVSDTAAATLRARLIADSSPFGVDANGNPKLPDFRGRTAIGKDNMGGTAASLVTTAGSGVDGKTLGASGGAQTHLLTTAQMPAHAHSVSDAGHAHGISDPGHNHGFTDPGHNHGFTDPGHVHGVYDPTHGHSIADPGHAHGVADPGHAHAVFGSNGTSVIAGQSLLGVSGNTNNVNGSTNAVGTGIGIYGSGTGIGIYGAATGISIYGAATGITIYAAGTGASIRAAASGITISGAATGISVASTGGGTAHNNMQPSLVVNKIIKL